jgi:hypothetical protein
MCVCLHLCTCYGVDMHTYHIHSDCLLAYCAYSAWIHTTGPCVPCPQTPGSDCSRCDNNWDGSSSFTPPCDGCAGSTHQRAIRDLIKIPADLVRRETRREDEEEEEEE